MEHPPAVHNQKLGGHEGAGVGGQADERAREVLGHFGALDRALLAALLDPLVRLAIASSITESAQDSYHAPFNPPPW